MSFFDEVSVDDAIQKLEESSEEEFLEKARSAGFIKDESESQFIFQFDEINYDESAVEWPVESPLADNSYSVSDMTRPLAA